MMIKILGASTIFGGVLLHTTGKICEKRIMKRIDKMCSQKQPMSPYSSSGRIITENEKETIIHRNKKRNECVKDKIVNQNGLWGAIMMKLNSYGAMGEYDPLFGYASVEAVNCNNCDGFHCGFPHCTWCNDFDNYEKELKYLQSMRNVGSTPPQITF